jgi:small subunit ribosomal protein S9
MSENPIPAAASTSTEPTGPVVNTIVLGTGRRKTAVARVRLIPGGSGQIVINEKPFETYFPGHRDQTDVAAPLDLAGIRKNWDVKARANGGGTTGQAGAMKLAIARAVVKAYPQHEAALRDAGFLTRDAREVERKKYGHRKARRRFQFSKR